MEYINSIRFLTTTIFLLMVMVVVLFNKIVNDYENNQKHALEIIKKLNEENYNLKVYKAKKEFENKGRYDFK